jgi:hypothetical protein
MKATKTQARPGVMVGAVDVDKGKVSVQSSRVFRQALVVAKYPASERHSQERIAGVHDTEPFVVSFIFHDEMDGALCHPWRNPGYRGPKTGRGLKGRRN